MESDIDASGYRKQGAFGRTSDKGKERQGVGFAVRVPRFTLEGDAILPKTTRLQIEEALAKIQFHHKIYEEWGFGKVDPMGKGIVLNFYGESGTGKTLTAEALAGSLNKQFLSLGMSDVESKYMGETAKNIRHAFQLTSEQDAVLFFDEADTLLGRRLSNVTQGIDNEVNALRSTLLIEIEQFKGVVIFATNFVSNYDKAFESRITYHIHFELPDIESRRLLWSKFLIDSIPMSSTRSSLVDAAADETSKFSGRDIRTCMRLALPKAILGSRESGNMAMLTWDHLLEAIKQVRSSKEIIESDSSSDAARSSRSREIVHFLGNRAAKSESSNERDL